MISPWKNRLYVISFSQILRWNLKKLAMMLIVFFVLSYFCSDNQMPEWTTHLLPWMRGKLFWVTHNSWKYRGWAGNWAELSFVGSLWITNRIQYFEGCFISNKTSPRYRRTEWSCSECSVGRSTHWMPWMSVFLHYWVGGNGFWTTLHSLPQMS